MLGLEVAARLLPLESKGTLDAERPHLYYLPAAAHSARGNVFSPIKDPKATRISVIGDSFTFGPKMQFFDTFPFRLEKLLNFNNKSQLAEVISFGSPGFSTHHEAQIVKNALDIQSDVIILQITLNDAQEEPYRKNSNSLNEGILSYSRLYQLISNRIKAYQSKQEYIDYHYQLFSNQKTRLLFEESLSKIKIEAEQNGTRLVAVLFPLFDFPIDENYPFKELHRQIIETLKAKNIPALDLTKAYKGLDVKRLQLIPDHDSHPNEIGHRIASEEIFNWLRDEQILPRQMFSTREYPARDGVYEQQVKDSSEAKRRVS